MTKPFVTAGLALAGFIAVTAAVQAESPRNELHEDVQVRTGAGRLTTHNTYDSGAMAGRSQTNDNIEPAAGPEPMSTAPTSNNTYDTTGVKVRKDIRDGGM